MTKSITLPGLLLLFTGPIFTQSSPEFDPAEITKILYDYIDEEDPGLAVGIVKDGEIIYEEYLGYANLEHQIKVDERTRFNIASTAKQYTALMVLELSLAGQLSLEDDIRKYLPQLYPEVKEAIRIRQLINHTSGIRDYVFILEMMNQPWWRQIGMDNDDVIELLEKQNTLAATPGTRYIYSNSGYTVLTKIIEQVSGEKFNDYSRQFFADLGMNESAFVERYMGVIPNRADAYSDWGNGVWLATPMVTKFNGDGFLYTTLKDQLIFEQAIQRAEAQQNTLLLKSQQAIPNSEIEDYGFGLELDGRLGLEAQYHSGSTFGYHSHTNRFPEEKLSVFVMSNNGQFWSGDLSDEIAMVLLSPIEEQTIYDEQFNAALSEEQPVQITGQYVSPDGFLSRIVEEEDKILWRNANNSPYELLPEKGNTFSVDYNTDIKVGFYEDQLIRFYPSGKKIIYQRQEIKPASMADLDGLVGTYRSQELDMSFELTLTKANQLKALFSNRDRAWEVSVLNRNELVASNFILQVERDAFDRPMEVLVTLNYRAQKNRFKKETNLKFQPKIATEDGSIQVTTIESRSGEGSDILLTKNYPNGNEIWYKRFGGNSYDKVSSILSTDDGYLIVGSTSSYGAGNYDIFVIKTDKAGKKQWQNTYGGFYNEYGYTAEQTGQGFCIKGTQQYCTSNSDVFNRECTTNVWWVSIDENGKELSNQLLEEIK